MAKIKTSEILQGLKADLKAAETLRKELDGKIDQWKREYNGEPYGNEVKGKSKIVSRDIKKQSEWQHAALIDPFVSNPDIIKANPVTAEDRAAARQNEVILNTQFCRQFNRYNFMTKTVKLLDQEGTAVVMTGWEYEDKDVEVEVPVVEIDPLTGQQIVTGYTTASETVIVENRPTAKVVRNEDVFIDPTCQDDMDKCQFVIYRYESDMSTLKQDGRYKNLEKIGRDTTDYDYDPEDETVFKFSDDPRKKLVVYEYWGNYDVNGDGIAEPIVCTWVGDVVIRLQDNPYPDKKPPFIIVPFNSVPFQMHGESNAELLSDTQKIKTAIYRGFIDNMAQSNNAQKGIRKGALDGLNRKRYLNGQNFEFNGTPNDFWDGSYNEIPGSAFNVLQLMNNEAESITGVKSFGQGLTGASLGNMLDINTDIPMIDGTFKKLVDIKDGDKIVGSDGNATTVLKAHEVKFPKVAYDMDFDNGSVVKSGGEHLWTVKVHGTKHSLREWTTMNADEVYKHMQKGRRVIIPAMKEMRAGTPTGNSIDPYVLGFWLGDGMSHSARITCADSEVIGYFNEAGYDCVAVKDSSKTGKATMYDVYKKGTKTEYNNKGYAPNGSFHSELRELGVHARYGGEKHIPEEYFTATYEEKMELIRGLMDSDGYQHSGAFVQFAQSEGRLKDDFIRLIESLGLKVSIRVKDMDTINKIKLAHSERTGTKMVWARKDAYEIGFTPWSNPFKLTRKASKWQLPKKQSVALKEMKIVDKVLMRCLTVDSEDKLFAVTNKFTLTHNTATGARGVLDSTATRRLNLVRNISENLIKPLMRKWMAYNSEFLDEGSVFRITNEEFIEIKQDDLMGLIDIEISVSTTEDNQAKAQELAFMLQTIGPSEDPTIRKMLMAEIARLNKMPDLAKKLEEFEPQPDPMEQQYNQLQLQLLQAQVRNEIAKGAENEVDVQLKTAKTQNELAKAKALDSKADLDDLTFLERESGLDHQKEMEKKNFDRLSKLDEKAMDLRYRK